MKNICFDLCAIPIYILILLAPNGRRMKSDRSYRVFRWMTVLSLLCAVADICMEYVVNPTPLSPAAVALGTFISFAYKLLRNAGLVIYIIFIFHITKTDYRIRSMKMHFLLWLPNALLVILLIQNFFTGNVFSVTEAGYMRGPLLVLFYAVALLYGVTGIVYCVACKPYLETDKWLALLSVYALTGVAVYVQMVRPDLMVEMFSTAVGLLIVMIMVLRPEERMDAVTGALSWKSFLSDLHNTLLSGERIQLIVFHMPNAKERRYFLGDSSYNEFIREIVGAIQVYLKTQKTEFQVYFEHPGNIYLTVEDHAGLDAERLLNGCLSAVRERLRSFNHRDMRFDPQVCLIRCPGDLVKQHDIINLCHHFPTLGKRGQTLFIASDIVASRDFDIENHIDEILLRSAEEHELEMYYQPIYDVREKRFRSAEALARLNDKEFGMISPAIFIPAAERSGSIQFLGREVIESVFRFISEHDLGELGLSFIEINLSVAQCMQYDLPDIILHLQEKYGVSPSQVNFEITESIFDNLSTIMDRNIRKLSEMGYSFSLDDYGVGYSNIQRLRRLPLSLIKIDKSLVDDMFTPDGGVIIRNTVHMMQGIRKELIMEGVETREAVETLDSMSCDFIQGFYFCRPLPAEDFVRFLKDNNNACA